MYAEKSKQRGFGSLSSQDLSLMQSREHVSVRSALMGVWGASYSWQMAMYERSVRQVNLLAIRSSEGGEPLVYSAGQLCTEQRPLSLSRDSILESQAYLLSVHQTIP